MGRTTWWDCPGCQKNTSGGACQYCGRPRPKEEPAPASVAPVDDRPKKHEYTALEYCAWKTQGRQCLMLASIWNQERTRDRGGKTDQEGYCHWHHQCKASPGLAQKFGSYERFVQYLKDSKVCTQFSHHPTEYSFRATRGISIVDPANRLLVEPCEAGDCWAPKALKDHQEAKLNEEERQAQGELLDPDEVATKLHEVVQRIASQMSLPDAPVDEPE
jgi:hypothetical protein